jgi:chromate reductase
MSRTFDVAALVGSLRRESYTRTLVKAFMRLTPPALQIEIVEIGGLSIYNHDDEATPPAAWTDFRARIKRADAVLFATPEYNRSVPAVLKNAIDVGSRPLISNAWAHKPAAVVSLSPGVMGAFGANHHLRQSLVAVGMPTMAHPEVYIGGAPKLFDAAGEFIDPRPREFCQNFLVAFEVWIRRLTNPLPAP